MPALLSEDAVLHADLSGVHVHEPKNIHLASSGDVYVADGSGGGTWEPQVEIALPPRYIRGFTIENDVTDPTNDIVILAGSCRDSGDTEDIHLTTTLIKRLDAAWAVGTGNGGLDSGAIADTTYHLYVIKRTDTGVVDCLFSTAASNPTMPTDYDKRRRIASFRRVGGVIQVMDTYETEGGGLLTLITPISAASATYTPVATTVTLTGMPTGQKFDALISGSLLASAPGTGQLLFTSLDQADTAPSATILTAAAADVAPSSFQIRIKTNTSAQIRARVATIDLITNTTLNGWVDSRRQ